MLIRRTYEELYNKNRFFGMQEILEFLKKNPEIWSINKHIKKNEGYQKSLREDKIIKQD